MQFLYERVRRLTRDLAGLTYPCTRDIECFRYKKVAERITDIANLDTEGWAEIVPGETVRGDRLEYYYFETVVTIPEEFAGKTVVFRISTANDNNWDSINPQLLFFLDGKLRLGFDEFHHEAVISETAEAGRQYRIVLQAFTGDGNFRMQLNSSLKVLDRATEKYYYDVKVPLDVAAIIPFDGSDHKHIVGALNDSLNLLDLRIPGSPEYYASLAEAQAKLNRDFYEKYTDPGKDPVIYAVGHTHIDVAWLWTLAVTEDKTVRSFSSALELMREYPDYTFMSSQVQLYKFVEKNAPEVFEEIKERVAEGRWEVEGAMFVEADCNIASGEALVRQITSGKRYFRDKFDKVNEILWLPDVFGYSAALPQILKLAEVPYFMTTKISWNETNKIPYDTFEWQGIDGSKVLTHFIPTREYNRPVIPGHFANGHFTTYNGNLNAEQTLGSWQRYQQKNLNEFALMAYGHGDGGGGTTREMIENGRRLSKGLPGAPRIQFGTVLDFFHKLDEAVRNHRHLPTWAGELYLEYHRGTYTSMGRNKRNNRRSEYMLQNLEFLASLAARLSAAPYPSEVLTEGWEILMRNQFHDILPGTSIKEVYDDSDREYARLAEIVGQASSEMIAKITAAVEGEAGTLLVLNPTSYEQNGPVVLPEDAKDAKALRLTGSSDLLSIQTLANGKRAFYAHAVPAFGFALYEFADEDQVDAAELGEVNPEGYVIENDYYRVTFNEKGQFAELYDKRADRQVLKPGEAGNVIMSYEDRPHNYENWDINNYYVEKSWEVDELASFALVEDGPVRKTIRIERPYLDSTIVQEIHLYKDSPRIDVDNDIDWKQERIMMKALFPVNVYTHEATFEIQYGHVKRQTHYNTSWDQARFEVAMHKWLDISEYGYGVSFLNDCKYGSHVHNGVVGLTLLKSGTDPHPNADKERHIFTYSLLAHEGTWQEAGTLEAAYNLNNPLQAVVKKEEGGSVDANYSLVQLDKPGITVEVIKKAEDSDQTVIRLYESFGQTHQATMKLAFEPEHVAITNLLEKEIAPADWSGSQIQVDLKPFEIRTYVIS